MQHYNVLAIDITVNIDNGAAPIAFDRSTITKDGLSTANTDLKTLDLAKVDVYDAGRLENELIDQVYHKKYSI
jgi:hypothetical protein